MDANRSPWTRNFIIVLALMAAVALTYRYMLECDFVNYDEPGYVSENPRVQQGLSLETLRWAFTFTYGNWTPLTTLSYMADCQFFGLDARWHHAVNVAFHML